MGEVLCLEPVVASIVLVVGRGENHDERKGRSTSGPGGPSGIERVELCFYPVDSVVQLPNAQP